MKKGFTLIELLAVIVVLAIVAVIAIPIITNVIEKARSAALKDSAYGLIESANLYYATSITKGENFDETTFNLVDGKLVSGSKELNYKGQKFKGSSYVAINEVGSVKLMITDGKYYASKEYDEVNVTMSDSQDDALTREELTAKLNEANEKIVTLNTEMENLKSDVEGLKTKISSKKFSFTFTNVSYFSPPNNSILTYSNIVKKEGQIVSIRVDIALLLDLTPWTAYQVGTISDWSFGVRSCTIPGSAFGIPLVFSIDKNGVVTAVKRGSETITTDWYQLDMTFAI